MKNIYGGLWIVNNIRNNWGIGRATKDKNSQPDRSKREDLNKCSHMCCIYWNKCQLNNSGCGTQNIDDKSMREVQ